MSASFQAESSAISAVFSMPSFSMSSIVSTFVSRSRATSTPARGTCQPPIPSWTEILGRDIRKVGRPIPGRVVHPLIHVLRLRIEMPVEVDDANSF